MLSPIISDGWNVQMFHHHLILGKPLQNFSRPPYLLCSTCLKLWLIFAFFCCIKSFLYQDVIDYFSVWFFFFNVWPSGFVLFYCLERVWGILGWTNLSLEVVSIKTSSLCPRLGVPGGSAEPREGLKLYYGNCLAQGRECPAQMTLQPVWERDWWTSSASEESFALHPVTCFSCLLWHGAGFCLKCA